MPSRLRYPEFAPEGYASLSAFGHYINTATTLAPGLIGLVNLRVSLLNGCDFCIQMHSGELRKLHEPQTRIDAVAKWGESNAFTPRERAALRWADVLTQLPGDHASDEEYNAVSEFFHEKDLVDLTFAIANINAWNRMGVGFRPHWNPQKAVAQTLHEEPDHASESAVDDDGGKVAQDG